MWDCGTVRLNHKQMPVDLKTVKLKQGECVFRSSDSLLALVWNNKKDVKILSTMHSSSMEDTGKKDKSDNPIEKPICVIDYNRGQCGVDLSHQIDLAIAACESQSSGIRRFVSTWWTWL